MPLKEKLDAIRDASSKRIPPDRQAIMHRATADLRASGILDAIVKVGQPMPAFAGVAHDGRSIEFACATRSRPAVALVLPRSLVTLLPHRAGCSANHLR